MRYLPPVDAETLLEFALRSEALAFRHVDISRAPYTGAQSFEAWWGHVRTWVHPLYCHQVKPTQLPTRVMLYVARSLKYHFDDLNKGERR